MPVLSVCDIKWGRRTQYNNRMWYVCQGGHRAFVKSGIGIMGYKYGINISAICSPKELGASMFILLVNIAGVSNTMEF